MIFYSLIISILFIPFSSFAQVLPSSFAGNYTSVKMTCSSRHGFYENVKQVNIHESVITLDTCELNEDCEGRLPYFHFYLKDIVNQGEWVTGKNDLWEASRFMLKELTSETLLLKIEIFNRNAQKTICTSQLVRN